MAIPLIRWFARPSPLLLLAVAVAASTKTAAQADDPAISHAFLACGVETRILDNHGKNVWSLPAIVSRRVGARERPRPAGPRTNKTFPGGAAVEVTRDGKVVFEFKGTQSEVNTVQPLATAASC